MTLTQLTLEEAATDQKIASVYGSADPRWKRAARDWILTLNSGREFLAEDLRAYLDSIDVETFDLRALGAVCKHARDAGLLEKVGYAPAATSHGSPKTVWRRTEAR